MDVLSSTLIFKLDFLLFFFQYRFKFPSVFIIYQNITVVVGAVFVLIGYTAKEPLFCSSDDVTESLDNATSFCTIIGRSSLNCTSQIFVKQKPWFFWVCNIRGLVLSFEVGGFFVHMVKFQSNSQTSSCYRYCFILHSATTSTMGYFSGGGVVLGCYVSNPHAAAWGLRQDQVPPHHDGATGSHSALCASCSCFWHWRIFTQRHSLSSHHLLWGRQRSYCVLSQHCWQHYNSHRSFPSDTCFSEVHQGKIFID